MHSYCLTYCAVSIYCIYDRLLRHCQHIERPEHKQSKAAVGWVLARDQHAADAQALLYRSAIVEAEYSTVLCW